MIDNKKIHLPDFTGDFKKCSKPRDINEKVQIYTLSRSEKKGDPKLRIQWNRENNKVVISGSLRKWCYGKLSMRDLTLSSYIRTLKKLAKALNITFQELCRGGFTQCEIGLNIWIKVPCKEIIPKIIDYHHLIRVPYNSTVYFMGTSKKLTIYNKGDEIVHITPQKRKLSKAKAFNVLERKGYHFLRMEFKLFNQKSFKQHHMGHIRTIGDLINNYSDLYEFWCTEISDLIICNTLIPNSETTKQEFLFIHTINTLGFTKFTEEYLMLCKSETKKGLITAKSKEYKKVSDIVDKFGSMDEYNKTSLKVDIAKTLLKISKIDNAVSLPFLLRTLWKSKQLI